MRSIAFTVATLIRDTAPEAHRHWEFCECHFGPREDAEETRVRVNRQD